MFPFPSAILRFSLIVVLIFTAGCGRKESDVEKGIREGVLLIGNGAEPEDLDPHVVTGLPEYRILMGLFEGLTAYEPGTMAIVPGVAERWEISEDGRRYRFYLRENARWSDGKAVTAHDFEYAWRRVLSPKLGNRYTYLYDDIRNATAFYTGNVDWSEVGVRVESDRVLTVELSQPAPYFLGLMTHNTFFPVSRATIELYGAMDQRGTAWTKPGNLVSNGPFALHEWRNASHLEIRPNPHYWDRSAVKLNAVRYLPIESVDTEERAFRNGQLHVTSTVPAHLIPALRARQAPELQLAPFLAVYYYELNVTKPPLNDPRVRRALSLAVDRKALVERVTQGNEAPAHTFIQAGALDGQEGPVFTEDITEARRLLAEAGFPEGKGFPPLEILYNTQEAHRAIAEALQQMWQRNLGVQLRLTNQEWQVYLANRRQGNFALARAGWVASYRDATVFSNLLLSDSGNNHTGWKSRDYDRVALAARNALDPKQRIQLFHQANAILNEEMPVIPLYFYTSKYLLHPAVKGWHQNLLNLHPIKAVSLGEPESKP